MNEETITSAMNEDTVLETDSTSAMEDDWDDIDLSDLKDDDVDDTDSEENEPETEEQPPEADQQTGEDEDEEEDSADDAEQAPPQENGEEKQTFDLKFLGETKTVNREEVITLAQKGLNYDKVLGERDTARGEVARLQEYESFLKELAAMDGSTIEDLMDGTKADLLAKKEGIDRSVALQRVKLDRREKAIDAKQAKANAEQQAKKEAEKKQGDDLLRFVQAYPEVKAQDIPKEVWEKVHDGLPLVTAYSIYDNKKLREEVKSWKDRVEAAEQNAKNKERSTGSQATAGAGSTKKKDPIDDDWYSGD